MRAPSPASITVWYAAILSLWGKGTSRANAERPSPAPPFTVRDLEIEIEILIEIGSPSMRHGKAQAKAIPLSGRA